MHACMYVCMYVSMYNVCIHMLYTITLVSHVYTYIYIYILYIICMHIHIHIHIIYIYVCICICMYVCTYIYIYISITNITLIHCWVLSVLNPVRYHHHHHHHHHRYQCVFIRSNSFFLDKTTLQSLRSFWSCETWPYSPKYSSPHLESKILIKD